MTINRTNLIIFNSLCREKIKCKTIFYLNQYCSIRDEARDMIGCIDNIEVTERMKKAKTERMKKAKTVEKEAKEND